MEDGEPDFSRYTAEQIARSLRSIDREKYPLNYAKLLAARAALPPSPPALDAATLEESRKIALRQAMANGEIWLSASWTLLMNTVVAGIFVAWGSWLVWRFVDDPAGVWNFDQLKAWPVMGRQAFGLLMIGFSAFLAWTTIRLRRVVMVEGRLEVLGLFARASIGLEDIERIRWNDAPEKYRKTQAVIELRADSAFGRRLRFMPKSCEKMRAFAAHVSALQGRNVADPAFVSFFFVGAADP